ncbi:hypothetical protein [Candidatus Palauibacter sp.]
MLFDAAHHAGFAPGALRLTPGPGVPAVVPLEGLARLELEERPGGAG